MLITQAVFGTSIFTFFDSTRTLKTLENPTADVKILKQRVVVIYTQNKGPMAQFEETCCVRVCVCACMRACVRVSVCMCIHVCPCEDFHCSLEHCL